MANKAKTTTEEARAYTVNRLAKRIGRTETSTGALDACLASNDEAPQKPDDLADISLWRHALYLLVGAGRRGKTVLARYFLMRSKENGVVLRAIDLERVNRGLRMSHPDEVDWPKDGSPIDGQSLASWLYPRIVEIPAKGSLLVDFEGNDGRFLEMCRESDLLAVAEEADIPIVILFVTGGGPDDLALTQEVALALGTESRARRAAVALVRQDLLPAHLRVGGTYAAEMFGSEGFGELLRNPSSSIVQLPQCVVISKLDRVKISYRDAARTAGHKGPLPLYERTMISTYLRKLDKLLANVVPRK